MMGLESSEQLRINNEMKDTEVRKVQEQLAEVYQSQQQEIDSLDGQLRELQT